MSSQKSVIERLKSGIATEAQARGNALRESFTVRLPVSGWKGWLRWLFWKLLIITLIALRGWVHIIAIAIAAAYFMYDLPPTRLLENWKQMRGQ